MKEILINKTPQPAPGYAAIHLETETFMPLKRVCLDVRIERLQDLIMLKSREEAAAIIGEELLTILDTLNAHLKITN